jgi:two-component system OmpR family response regulator
MSDSEDRAVDVMVSRLRRKLEPSEDSPSIVKTVRGVGYLFQPTVTRA